MGRNMSSAQDSAHHQHNLNDYLPEDIRERVNSRQYFQNEYLVFLNLVISGISRSRIGIHWRRNWRNCLERNARDLARMSALCRIEVIIARAINSTAIMLAEEASTAR